MMHQMEIRRFFVFFILGIACGSIQADFTINQKNVTFSGSMMYKKEWKRIVCWCGHKLCNGTMSFTVKESGKFHVSVKGAEWKSQGATQCKLSINGNEVATGTFKDNGKCQKKGAKIKNGQTIDLGSHSFKKGDKVTFWSNNAFQCGINGPGSYSAFTHLQFKREGSVSLTDGSKQGIQRVSNQAIQTQSTLFDITGRKTVRSHRTLLRQKLVLLRRHRSRKACVTVHD